MAGHVISIMNEVRQDAFDGDTRCCSGICKRMKESVGDFPSERRTLIYMIDISYIIHGREGRQRLVMVNTDDSAFFFHHLQTLLNAIDVYIIIHISQVQPGR